MHLMSTKRERRFFEHGKYRFAAAAVIGVGLLDPMSYKPEWNRDKFVFYRLRHKELCGGGFFIPKGGNPYVFRS